MDQVGIFINDVEDTYQALRAALRYHQAKDLQEAQTAFTNVRPSALSVELERCCDKLRGYLGDFHFAQHEAELDAEDEDAESEAEEGSEIDSEELSKDDEELSDTPLGDFKAPRQEGRRLEADEI